MLLPRLEIGMNGSDDEVERHIVEGRLDESSEDPLKNQKSRSLQGHKNLGPSLLCCASLG